MTIDDLSLCEMRFSVLWLLWRVTDLCTGVLLLMEPNVIDYIRVGEIFGMEISPEFLLIGAIVYLIPILMVVLSLAFEAFDKSLDKPHLLRSLCGYWTHRDR